jgi:MSHA biogenesis protein MshG
MPQFKFKGRSSQGLAVDGLREAASADAVANQLIGRGITPISIQEVSSSQDIMRQINKALGAERVKHVDLIMFCRQMYTITRSGIPLVRGIRGLAASMRHLGFREILNDVSDRLESGVNLSQAMRHHPVVFNNLFISMIAVGESSGKLDEVFQQLGFYLERDEETRKRIKSALRYPSFVLIALAVALAIVNVVVIPQFAQMFDKFGADLPLLTRVLVGTSNLFVNHGWLILAASIAAVVGTAYYLKTPQGARRWGRLKLRLPIFGVIIDRASMARYARSFSLMLRAGVPINQVLSLCARTIDNPYLSEKIDNIRRGVERGEGLLRTHMQAQMFTPLVLQMVAVGEESGRVEELLTDVAEFYEREVDYDLKKLGDRIEPVLIVIMAVFVGILALGIMLPIWSIMEIQR